MDNLEECNSTTGMKSDSELEVAAVTEEETEEKTPE